MTVALSAKSTKMPFVWSVIGSDAAEPLSHIVLRKEAERSSGTGEHSGEFWWGLSAHLGPAVEAMAKQHCGNLPALFSPSRNAQVGRGQVRIWDEWESRLDPQRRGRIPSHIVVTSGFDPDSDSHYALTKLSFHSKTGARQPRPLRSSAVPDGEERQGS
jgi:hypothetical protein